MTPLDVLADQLADQLALDTFSPVQELPTAARELPSHGQAEAAEIGTSIGGGPTPIKHWTVVNHLHSTNIE